MEHVRHINMMFMEHVVCLQTMAPVNILQAMGHVLLQFKVFMVHAAQQPHTVYVLIQQDQQAIHILL